MREVDASDWLMPLRPIVRVEDDAGTSYRVAEVGGSASAGGYRSDIVLLPAPPDSATNLGVTIERLTDAPDVPFGAPLGARRSIEGPWTIQVQL